MERKRVLRAALAALCVLLALCRHGAGERDASPAADLPAPAIPAGLWAAEQEKRLFRDTLSLWETALAGSQARQDNVARSAEALHGLVLLPGEIFDFNAAVGERTAERGYAPAPSLLDGETADTVGGGICQTAGTLYMAALLADLEILERSGHSSPSSYMPLGLDAAVSWGGKNLRFRNDPGYPHRLAVQVEESALRAALIGTRLSETYVEMRGEVLRTLPFSTEEREDPSLAAGERRLLRAGREGVAVRTWREVYDGEGQLLRSALEAETVYPARGEIWLVGAAGAA